MEKLILYKGGKTEHQDLKFSEGNELKYGPGIYLSDSIEKAKKYGPIIQKIEINPTQVKFLFFNNRKDYYIEVAKFIGKNTIPNKEDCKSFNTHIFKKYDAFVIPSIGENGINEYIFGNDNHLKQDTLSEELNLSNLKINDTLNEKIWNNDKMIPIVKIDLLKIAKKFIDYLEMPDDTDIEDIIVTGSIANYNYTDQSDIDLHIIVDFKTVNPDFDLITKYFDFAEKNWKGLTNFKIYNHDVECYVQDSNDNLVAGGIYSIIKDEWVKHPEKKDIVFDKKMIKTKVIDIIKQIKSLEKSKETPEIILSELEKLKDKIKNYRSIGLDKNGEYSTENIVFKILRNNGFLDSLNKEKYNLLNKELSINN
jgi:predicted nucleotidyltransferase